MNSLWIPSLVDTSWLLCHGHGHLWPHFFSLTQWGPSQHVTLTCFVLLATLSSQPGRSSPAGLKSTGANTQTGLTLNYLHEWRSNPIFISTWLWNASYDLHRIDLPGYFCFAWVNSVSIFNMCMDCTPVTFWCGKEMNLGRRFWQRGST